MFLAPRRIGFLRIRKFLGDAAAVAVSFAAALELRFDFSPPAPYARDFLLALPIIVTLFLISNTLLGIYSGKWKTASFDEIWGIARADLIATIAIIIGVYAIPEARTHFPASVAIIGGALTLLVSLTIRLIYRAANEAQTKASDQSSKRVLLVGAGDAGEIVAQDMRKHPDYGYIPVAFVDDHPLKKNLVLRGTQVAGTRTDIPELVKTMDIDEIFITVPSARGADIRDIVGICETTEAKIKIIPGIMDTICGKLGVASVRELELEDLLGREQVKIDMASVTSQITDKRVLVTGAGGSIGSELCRQLIALGPQQLILLDNDETALFDLQHVLANISPKSETVVADIRDSRRILSVFEKYRPQVVFHSAAMKHVPMMECHPCEAVKNNVMGTLNVAEAALASGCDRFMLISTDKAVDPSNVMGATKRLAELLMKKFNTESSCMMGAVRFGNVLGSRGSVVPTFKNQIERGGPVLVTDPEVTRFFMTVNEAVQLVIQSAAFLKGGEVFVLDMGEPIKILELAEKMIAMMGKGKEIPIHFTGLRPGEKLEEALFYETETLLPTHHPKIHLAKEGHNGLSGLNSGIETLIAYALEEKGEEARSILLDLVASSNSSSIDRELREDR